MAEEAILITDAWINEAPPTVSILAAYLKITNNSGHDVSVLEITSPFFSKIEIHRSIITDGMASMEKQNSLLIPAGKTIEFKPGDYHLMLFDPKSPLQSGQRAILDFVFSNNETISVETYIERRDNMDHEHHHH